MVRASNNKDAADNAAQEAAKSPERPKPAPKDKPGQMIYLGPRLAGGALHHGQVFKPPLPAPVTELAEAHPDLLPPLLVPLAGLAKARRDLADPASDLARIYRDAAEKLGGNQ